MEVWKMPLPGLGNRMRNALVILAVLTVSLTPIVAKNADDAAILAAAENYLTSNATVITKVKYIVEQVDGDLARVRINPEDRPTRDTAWIFLKNIEGKWTGISSRA